GSNHYLQVAVSGSVDVDYCMPCVVGNGSRHGDLQVVVAACWKFEYFVVGEGTTLAPCWGYFISGLIWWPPGYRQWLVDRKPDRSTIDVGSSISVDLDSG